MILNLGKFVRTHLNQLREGMQRNVSHLNSKRYFSSKYFHL